MIGGKAPSALTAMPFAMTAFLSLLSCERRIALAIGGQSVGKVDILEPVAAMLWPHLRCTES